MAAVGHRDFDGVLTFAWCCDDGVCIQLHILAHQVTSAIIQKQIQVETVFVAGAIDGLTCQKVAADGGALAVVQPLSTAITCVGYGSAWGAAANGKAMVGANVSRAACCMGAVGHGDFHREGAVVGCSNHWNRVQVNILRQQVASAVIQEQV